MGVDIYLQSDGAEFSCRLYWIKDKKKKLAYYDSTYFKKIKGINSSLKNLISLIKSKPIDKSIVFKAEIQESFNEKISLVQKIIPILTKIASGRGSVRID